ncbi:MAG: cyclophilin-like fold protein [Candidatus Omnitrophota bacterium]
MKNITIEGADGKIELKIESFDNPTSKKISSSLPIESSAKTWGDEIYFDTGIAAPAEGGTIDLNVGDIAYWPDGRCLCIFFGKTPASTGDKPVPASKVVIIGKTEVDPVLLRKVKSGSKIRVE